MAAGEGTREVGSPANANIIQGFRGQSWRVDILRVMERGGLASHPHKKPSLSILGLSSRNRFRLVEKPERENCENRLFSKN